jgi:hypothetical protein
VTALTPGSAETPVTGSGQTTTDADGLGLALGLELGDGLALGLTLELGDGLAESLALALGDGLAESLPLALGDGLADVDSLADGLALLLALGSGDDAVADGDDESETCGDGSVVVVGPSVAVRAVIVSDVDASGDRSSDFSTVADGDALASSCVESSLADEEADALGESEAEGEVLGDGEADGDDSGDALGEIEVDGETDGDALMASVGSQRAGTCAGITQGSGSLEVASSFNVTSASASSLWEIGDDSWPWSTAFAGSVDAANEDNTTASEASHATNERRIGPFHLFAFVAAIGVAEGRPAG